MSLEQNSFCYPRFYFLWISFAFSISYIAQTILPVCRELNFWMNKHSGWNHLSSVTNANHVGVRRVSPVEWAERNPAHQSIFRVLDLLWLSGSLRKFRVHSEIASWGNERNHIAPDDKVLPGWCYRRANTWGRNHPHRLHYMEVVNSSTESGGYEKHAAYASFTRLHWKK